MVTLRRTQLATPASDRTMMTKAASGDADEVFLDLEDSVAPSQKPSARETLVEAVTEEDWSGITLSFRMNGVDTEWWYRDLIDVITDVGETIDDIIVPKVDHPSTVDTVENLLAAVETNAGLEPGGIGLEPQIESGRALHNVHDIANASDRISALIFGPGDFAADMGAPGLDIGQFPEYPGHYWHHALSECNAAAKSAGVPCIDGPYADIDDPAGYRESAERANMLGCDGKWAVHPDQVEIGNEVFSPDPETAERAARIVEAYQEAMEEGRGAVQVDGQMVDEATHKVATDIVDRARAAGIID
ncbi:MAG: CoA ester lyase [Halodesulfurarchaeum sp.]